MEHMIPQIPVEPDLHLAFGGDRDAIERLIDAEVDLTGRWVGYSDATMIWIKFNNYTRSEY